MFHITKQHNSINEKGEIKNLSQNDSLIWNICEYFIITLSDCILLIQYVCQYQSVIHNFQLNIIIQIDIDNQLYYFSFSWNYNYISKVCSLILVWCIRK